MPKLCENIAIFKVFDAAHNVLESGNSVWKILSDNSVGKMGPFTDTAVMNAK